MAKPTEKEAAPDLMPVHELRNTIVKQMITIGKAGVRLSADKAWLRPAIEGAIEKRMKDAADNVPDEHLLSVQAALAALQH